MIKRAISNKSFQVDALDGLRGVAALIVVASHTSNNAWYFLPEANFKGIGKTGVYLFFILSSFLLTLPLLAKGKAIFSAPEISRYWQRRFFRVFPLYTVYLLAGLVSTYFLTNYFDKPDLGIPFVLSFEEFLRQMTLQAGKSVTWSIAVEFKFYFLLPFIALALAWISKYGVRYVVVVLALAILVFQQIFPADEVSKATRHELWPYMPIFLVGMGLAVMQAKFNQHGGISDTSKKFLNILAYFSLIALFLMIPSVFSHLFYEVPGDYFQKEYVSHSLLWAVVLISAVNGKGMIGWFLSLTAIRYFGYISFSLYLFHPVFIGLLRYSGLDTPINAWFVLFASVITAHISFVLIEGPCSRIRFRKPPQIQAD